MNWRRLGALFACAASLLAPSIACGSFTAPVGLINPTGTVALATGGTAFAIPDTQTTTSSDEVFCRDVFLPVGAQNIRARIANRYPGGSTIASATANTAWYTSAPGNSNLVSGTPDLATVTVPGDGTFTGNITTTVGAGSDGKRIFCYSIPNGTLAVNLPQQHHGWQIDGTTTVSPLAVPSSQTTTVWYWVDISYELPATSPRYIVLGDSILVGSTTGSDAQIRSVGFENAAWSQIAASESSWSVDIEGQPGVTLATWADYSGAGARLWDQPNWAGAHAVIQAGTNDEPNGYAAMETALTAVVAHLNALGVASISVSNLTPAAAYSGNNSDRLTFNAFEASNTLGFVPVVVGNPAIADFATPFTDPFNTVAIQTQYEIDGTHYSLAGHALAASILISGAPAPAPYSNTLFSSASTPQGVLSLSREAGIGVDSYIAGHLVGVRWYKPTGETGSHTVNVWTTGDTLLQSVPQASETASGWQEQAITPISYAAFDTIIVSVNTNVKLCQNLSDPLKLNIVNDNLRSLANGTAYTIAGVGHTYAGGSFLGTTLGAFPAALASDGETFMVDVDFTVP